MQREATMNSRRLSLDHDRLWAAIDAIAAAAGLSPSGLARRAGLDATAFNRSKRRTGDGRPRWPSTESLAKVLDATGTGLDAFARLIADAAPVDRPQPRGFAPAEPPRPLGFQESDGLVPFGATPIFDDLAGTGESIYHLRVSDETWLPCYRPGDVLIVSAEAQIRPGDRVVVRTADGRVGAHVFLGRRGGGMDLAALGGHGPTRRLEAAEVAWSARILWASQ
jgi:phage repressor protein C with HTH and peptisase S24 domain